MRRLPIPTESLIDLQRRLPAMIYTDKGPIARSHVFLQVIKCLGIQVRTHIPAGIRQVQLRISST
jgi:hypothetical protein